MHAAQYTATQVAVKRPTSQVGTVSGGGRGPGGEAHWQDSSGLELLGSLESGSMAPEAVAELRVDLVGVLSSFQLVINLLPPND